MVSSKKQIKQMKEMKEIVKWECNECGYYNKYNGEDKPVCGKCPLKFECKNGHIFYLSPIDLINNGKWCEECV